MEREQFFTLLKMLHTECEKVNEKAKEINIIYEVLQFSDLAKSPHIVNEVADFYDVNWTGNKDFIHIPDFNQALYNCLNFPVIIAREKDGKEILGISTLKYDENINKLDPYFPYPNAKYLSSTGALVKKGYPHKGLGQTIIEICIKSVHNYTSVYPDTRLMAVIDCRNIRSLNALSRAVSNVTAQIPELSKNTGLPVYIIGYYELRDHKKNLLEAPTLVLEVNLSGEDFKEGNHSSLNVDYSASENDDLFNSLLSSLKEALNHYGIEEPAIQEDTDSGIVYYYPLQERCRADKLNTNPNGTELGNNRTPSKNRDSRNFVGPVPNISLQKYMER